MAGPLVFDAFLTDSSNQHTKKVIDGHVRLQSQILQGWKDAELQIKAAKKHPESVQTVLQTLTKELNRERQIISRHVIVPDLGSVRAIGLESGKPDPHAGALRSILDIEIMHIIDHQFSEESFNPEDHLVFHVYQNQHMGLRWSLEDFRFLFDKSNHLSKDLDFSGYFQVYDIADFAKKGNKPDRLKPTLVFHNKQWDSTCPIKEAMKLRHLCFLGLSERITSTILHWAVSGHLHNVILYVPRQTRPQLSDALNKAEKINSEADLKSWEVKHDWKNYVPHLDQDDIHRSTTQHWCKICKFWLEEGSDFVVYVLPKANSVPPEQARLMPSSLGNEKHKLLEIVVEGTKKRENPILHPWDALDGLYLCNKHKVDAKEMNESANAAR